MLKFEKSAQDQGLWCENFTPQRANETYSSVFEAVTAEVKDSRKRRLGTLSWQSTVNLLKKIDRKKKAEAESDSDSDSQ